MIHLRRDGEFRQGGLVFANQDVVMVGISGRQKRGVEQGWLARAGYETSARSQPGALEWMERMEKVDRGCAVSLDRPSCEAGNGWQH